MGHGKPTVGLNLFAPVYVWIRFSWADFVQCYAKVHIYNFQRMDQEKQCRWRFTANLETVNLNSPFSNTLTFLVLLKKRLVPVKKRTLPSVCCVLFTGKLDDTTSTRSSNSNNTIKPKKRSWDICLYFRLHCLNTLAIKSRTSWSGCLLINYIGLLLWRRVWI